MSELFDQGGWVFVAIIAASLLAWAVIVWKLLQLRAERAGGFRWADEALAALRQRGPAQALTLCQGRQGAVARLMRQALQTREPHRRFFEKRLQPVLESEAAALRGRLPLLATLAGLLPLMGLLGTVLGMVQTFKALQATGLGDLDRLAEGISQALITTQAGLVVALPILLMHRVLAAAIDRHIERATLYVKKIETLRCSEE
jgi:biopolymer transport protein ExbB